MHNREAHVGMSWSVSLMARSPRENPGLIPQGAKIMAHFHQRMMPLRRSGCASATA